MDTTMKTIELTLPDSELSFIKTIAKKFGWTLTTKHTKTQKSLDEGIADIKAQTLFYTFIGNFSNRQK